MSELILPGKGSTDEIKGAIERDKLDEAFAKTGTRRDLDLARRRFFATTPAKRLKGIVGY
jgi:hypothetical protein